MQFGWKDGATNGVYAYNPLDPDEEALISDYPWERVGNAIQATIPLDALGLSQGQTVSISCFQEGASDGWATDFMESLEIKLTAGGPPAAAPVEVTDASDLGDSSGDVAKITATAEGDNLILTLESHGVTAPSADETPEGKTNRYYYHWLIDSDNNPATGVSNATYENKPTGVDRAIGTEIIVQFGWKDGATNGVYAYNPLAPDEEALISDYPWECVGNAIQATIPLDALGLSPGQSVAISCFQEGASDSWATDFINAVDLKIPSAEAGGGGNTNIIVIDDPTDDMLDPSGDIKQIRATSDGEHIYLGMTVESNITPAAGEEGEGLSNRYYYHWLIDSDNNSATGVSNTTYENEPTGVVRPMGSEIVIQIGWKGGAPDGVFAYDPTDPDEGGLISEYEWAAMGDSFEAKIPMAALNLSEGQRVAVSAFQEGASDGWATDWMESAEIVLSAPGSGGGADLSKRLFVNGFGFTAVLEDADGAEIDPASVTATLNGSALELTTSKEGAVTTVTAVFPERLEPGSEHALALVYDGGSTESPVVVGDYTVIPATYGQKALADVPRGFVVSASQISELQTNDGTSAHGHNLVKAEKQIAGELISPDGKRYYNEVSGVQQGWESVSTTIEGILNWAEEAPAGAGWCQWFGRRSVSLSGT